MGCELPDGWTRTRLAALCSKIGSGATPRGGREVYGDYGVAFIRSQNIYDDRFVADGLVRIDDAAAAKLSGASVHAGDVLINITGDSVARVNRAPDWIVPARVNQHVAIVRPKPAKTDGAFLHYVLASSPVKRQLLALASAGATRKALTKRMLEELDLTVPPIAEQRAIAEVLDTLDAKVASNRRLADAHERLSATLARRVACVGSAGSGWSEHRFSDAVEVNPRVRVARGQDTPFVEMAAVAPFATRPDIIRHRPYSSGCKFEPGDTLMARITGCIEHGKGAFADFVAEPSAGSTEFIVLRARPPLAPEVVFFLSRDARLRAHAIASMTGTSGRQRVDNRCFDAIQLSIAPASPERDDAAAEIAAAMRASLGIWRETRVLVAIRDALLPRLVSGQLRVPLSGDPGEQVGAAVEALG